MVINVSKVLAWYLKGSVFDLDEGYLCLSNVYFSSIHIEGPWIKLPFFMLCIRKKRWDERKQKRVELACASSIETLLNNKLAMLSSFVKGQNLSGWF